MVERFFYLGEGLEIEVNYQMVVGGDVQGRGSMKFGGYENDYGIIKKLKEFQLGRQVYCRVTCDKK